MNLYWVNIRRRFSMFNLYFCVFPILIFPSLFILNLRHSFSVDHIDRIVVLSFYNSIFNNLNSYKVLPFLTYNGLFILLRFIRKRIILLKFCVFPFLMC